MTNANGSNNWEVSFAAISFLENALRTHTAVASFTRVNDIQFEIVRRTVYSDVNAVLVNDYMLGEATVYAVLQEFVGVTAVVNNGNWNHIALDRKAFAKKTGVAVLLMADFLGALNVENLLEYSTAKEREERRRKR